MSEETELEKQIRIRDGLRFDMLRNGEEANRWVEQGLAEEHPLVAAPRKRSRTCERLIAHLDRKIEELIAEQ